MSARPYLRSFAAGEMTPELFGRVELRQFQTGAQKVRNFRVLPHGPLENRAGFAFVNHVKTPSKSVVLIPFIYSNDQSMVLEFGDQYIRFHTLGGTLLKTGQGITGITKANPGVVTYAGADDFVNGEWVYISGVVGMTEVNGRYFKVANVNVGANTFELQDTLGNNVNTTNYTTYSSGGTAAEVYEIASPYLEADLLNIHYTQSADVMTLVHPSYQQRQLSRLGATNWTLATLSFAPTQVAPTAVVVTPNAGGGTTYAYAVTSLDANGQEESVVATGSNAACQSLSVAGSFNTVTWTNAAGASRYNVYKRANGLYGYVGQADSGSTGFVDDNITPDFTQTPPLTNDPMNGANLYPGAVGYHRGRRWFGGSNTNPQTLYGTRSATESNMTYSIPTQDSDSITVRLTSRQANTIRHIVPLGDMLLLTSGAEWLVTTANSDVLSPTSIDYKVQGYAGASNVQPVVTSSAVIYPQARGGRLREMKYTWESQKYQSTDISIMAPHLFKGHTIMQMAYQPSEQPIAWCVRNDGVMLGVTYMPEQQVVAWHQHDTAGEFESVCVVPEGDSDVVYVSVVRNINGAVVRTIERQDERNFVRRDDAMFLDCSVSLRNEIAATLTPGTGANVAGTADVVFTAGSSVFIPAHVGRFIHYDYEEVDENGERQYKKAVAEITAYTSGTIVEARIDAAWPDLTAIASGDWRMTTTAITGLWHLEGEEVSVVGDAAVFPNATVTNGSLTLEQGASVVHVGLGYLSDFKSMPLALEIQAFGQATKKNVNRVHLRVYASSGLFAGPSFDKLKEVKQRTNEPYGTPPAPRTGRFNLMVTPTWDDDAPICVRQADPLPLTLLALAPEVAVGG